MENKSEKVEIWHGAMNWHHNAVVKIWNGLETVAILSLHKSSHLRWRFVVSRGNRLNVRDSWGIFFVYMIFFVWSTYAMKSLPCRFGIFRGSFAIFKWFTMFSLHLMQVIQIWTNKYTNYCTKMVIKSLLRCSPHVYALCKKNRKGNMWKQCFGTM